MRWRTLKYMMASVIFCISLSASARTYLVSVGVSDYSGYPVSISNLRLTVNDAQAIVDLYAGNRSMDYAVLTDGKATKDRILRAMRKVFGKASEDDIVVFFFSGHGYPGGLCAYDGDIDYEEVREAMAPSKSRNKMMFVDACRAGGLRDRKPADDSTNMDTRKANVMLFLSSRDGESSLERPDMENGFFTHYLCKGLGGDADVDGDDVVTARELFDFVHTGVGQISWERQRPVMWGNFDDGMKVMEWRGKEE